MATFGTDLAERNQTLDADDTTLKVVYDILSRYVWVVPVVFGVPGNILSILVATRKRNRCLSPCVYMTAMGVADTGQLLQLAWFVPLMYGGFGGHITHWRDFLFKFEWFMTYNCGMLSGTFLAQMSVDRLIAVRIPMAMCRLCTPPRAKKIVVVSFILITLVNLTTFYNHQYVKDSNTGIEILVVSVPGQPELEVLTSALQLILGSVCPFVIILVSNIVIIVTVKRASKERAKLKNKNATFEKHKRNGKESHMTRMLIFVSVAYVITSLPYRLFHLITDIPQVAIIYEMEKTYWNLLYNVQVWCVFNIWIWNYAINFYLYCVGGGKRYRQDAADVISKICPCCVGGARVRGLIEGVAST